MPSKARGGLSKREFAAKSGGQPISYGGGSKKSGGSSISGKIAAAEKAYAKSLKPTSEETAAEKTLNDYQIQADKDIQSTMKQSIPEFFVQGQAKNIEDRAEKIAVPLRLQVATMRARREAAANVASAKLKSATSAYERKQSAAKESASAEREALQTEKLRLDVAKAKKKGSGGSGSDAGDWQKVTVEKGPTGRVRNIIERNKKTGATRRTPVN